MRPEVQLATLRTTNFFPTVNVTIPADMPASVRITADAIAKQAGAPDANPGLLPVGLGALGGKFNQVYVDSFERIVLANQPVRTVLDQQAAALRALMLEANAPCWEPDKPSVGACPVK
jgi:multiple sugar transport system substrate-binding protein